MSVHESRPFNACRVADHVTAELEMTRKKLRSWKDKSSQMATLKNTLRASTRTGAIPSPDPKQISPPLSP